jgi:predicted amidohydrolase
VRACVRARARARACGLLVVAAAAVISRGTRARRINFGLEVFGRSALRGMNGRGSSCGGRVRNDTKNASSHGGICDVSLS